jgi:hypothetical protein
VRGVEKSEREVYGEDAYITKVIAMQGKDTTLKTDSATAAPFREMVLESTTKTTAFASSKCSRN